MAEQLGKYTVIRRLGLGGMAEVFLCKLSGIGGFEKYVVVKMIRVDISTDTEFITMFFDEARLAANLTHPNIIQVFEVDQLDRRPYLAMEYVRGATLATLMQKVRENKRRVEYGHLAYVFAGVCAGLDHAHNAEDSAGRQLKIVHRDISPQNIIVSSDGTPKIFDFGVAKARGSLATTGNDRVKGKFAYMAPEQLRAQPVDAKADVYAVGVCLYEAATGKRPFVGATEAELYAARMDGAFRMPSEVAPDIPVELEHMILAAMSPNPTDRPSAVELQEQLAAFCAARTQHPSSGPAVALWLKDLMGEDQEAYESYSSSSPSLTPLPRSIKAPTMNALELSSRKRGLGGIIALLSIAAIGLAAALVWIMLKKQQRDEPMVAKVDPPVAQSPADHETSIRTFLDEAENYIADKKYGVAAELLDKAAALETSNAALTVRRTELRHRLDHERTRQWAHEALAARDWPRATELANQLLAEAADDADARHILAVATAGQQQVAAAVPPPPTTDRMVKKDGKKKIVVAAAPPAKPGAAGSGSAIKVTGAAGSGSAARLSGAAGSGTATRLNGSTGSAGAGSAGAGSAGAGSTGSAQVAAQVPTTTTTTTTTPPPVTKPATPPVTPKITTTQVPRAATGPGSLDAVPSFSKVSVDGSLTTTEVQNALARTIEALRSCYRSAAQKAKQTPELSVKVSFEIDEGARARSVRVSGDTLGLAACTKDAIGDVRTRVAPDVGTVSVTAVVRFKPTR